ncbi:MAG: hypothetical protein IPN33_11400 [Saprospiraceae bacterium]|nr:hypothetical protein [Saprospiraceae bacterium]
MEIASQKEKNEREIKDDLQGIQLQAQLYVLNFQIEKAETMYDQILRLDSTDLTMLTEAAGFYRDYHRYDKAKRWYSAIIGHPDAERWEVGDAWRRLGSVQQQIGLPFAIIAFDSSEIIYKALLQSNPTLTSVKLSLAKSYSWLFPIYQQMGNTDKALGYAKRYSIICQELYESFPKNAEYEELFAYSFDQIGGVYEYLGYLDTA